MSSRRIEGELNAAGKRFAIVGARWNELFSNSLVSAAEEALAKHGAAESDITVVRVPGSFELPLAVQKLAQTKRYDAIVAVGVLIEGETDHYQLVASQVSSGLARVMLETGVPVTFGVITAKTMDQAMARAGSKAGNLGWQAAVAAVEMASVTSQID